MQRLESLNQHLEAKEAAWVMKNIEPLKLEKHGSLNGKTLFISGASRGIGLYIALKAARDGANVAIAAKTVEPHPKLGGTIYTAAQEINKAGGKALPIKCDIRDEKSVKEAIELTVKTFGGIDILINNASALYQAPVEKTDMKRFDLAMSINTRGTFLCSKYAIPHLKKSENPQILTISPPLYAGQMTNPNWFANIGTGYVLAKYGMTLITHGLSEELKEYKIGCSTLWPRTMIATDAVKNLLGGDSSLEISRSPEIMGDAAYEILTSKQCCVNGQFFMDDEVLASTGVQDFSKYRMSSKVNDSKLWPDFIC